MAEKNCTRITLKVSLFYLKKYKRNKFREPTAEVTAGNAFGETQR